jgi:hypothetical protein
VYINKGPGDNKFLHVTDVRLRTISKSSYSPTQYNLSEDKILQKLKRHIKPGVILSEKYVPTA